MQASAPYAMSFMVPLRTGSRIPQRNGIYRSHSDVMFLVEDSRRLPAVGENPVDPGNRVRKQRLFCLRALPRPSPECLRQVLSAKYSHDGNVLPFNTIINRMRPVCTAPIPLADVIDGLILHRVVCYFLKARFQPIKILFGLRQPEVFQPVQDDIEQVPSASGASS